MTRPGPNREINRQVAAIWPLLRNRSSPRCSRARCAEFGSIFMTQLEQEEEQPLPLAAAAAAAAAAAGAAVGVVP